MVIWHTVWLLLHATENPNKSTRNQPITAKRTKRWHNATISFLAIHFFPPDCRKLIQFNTERIRSYSFPFSSFIPFSTNSNLSWEVSLAPDSLSFFNFISPFFLWEKQGSFFSRYLLSPFTSCTLIHVILVTSSLSGSSIFYIYVFLFKSRYLFLSMKFHCW